MNIDIRYNNRKSDILEYRKIVDVLGVEKSPISLAEFQDLKYNDVERYKELKDRVVWSEAKFPSEKSLNGHFKSHGSEFANISKEQYQEAAASLLAEPVSEDILGYETDNRRVRYDRENNIIAIGKIGKNRSVKITTMFRLDEKEEYYYDDYEREHNYN